MFDIYHKGMLEARVWAAEARLGSGLGQHKAFAVVLEMMRAQGSMGCNRDNGLG